MNWPDTARHSRAQTGPSDSPEGYRARVSKEVDLFLSFYLVWEMLLLARPNFNSKTVSNHLFKPLGEGDGKLLFRSTQPSRPPLSPPRPPLPPPPRPSPPPPPPQTKI